MKWHIIGTIIEIIDTETKSQNFRKTVDDREKYDPLVILWERDVTLEFFTVRGIGMQVLLCEE